MCTTSRSLWMRRQLQESSGTQRCSSSCLSRVSRCRFADTVAADCALFNSTASRASSFLSISGLALDPTDRHTLHSSPPSILIRQVQSPDLSASRDSLPSSTLARTTTSIDCRIPLLRICLNKTTLDGLQLFADDLAQWSGRAFAAVGYESEFEPERNPKMIGSRYFGAKSFSRQRKMGSDSSESGSEGASAVTFEVTFTDGQFARVRGSLELMISPSQLSLTFSCLPARPRRLVICTVSLQISRSRSTCFVIAR